MLKKLTLQRDVSDKISAHGYISKLRPFYLIFFLQKITDLTEQNVLGRMFKRWAGCGREMFTDADTFGVTCK